MYQTMRFQTIFDSVEKWLNYVHNLNIYDDEHDSVSEALANEIYYLIYNRYYTMGIAYDYPDMFTAELGIALKEYFVQFKKHRDILAEIMKLDKNDYAELGTAIMNYANNPNYNTASNTDDWAFLTYISNQSRSKNYANKLGAYINALRQQPDMQINAFLQKIDYMWLNIIPREQVLFSDEED